jgi:hypothetical protein
MREEAKLKEIESKESLMKENEEAKLKAEWQEYLANQPVEKQKSSFWDWLFRRT